MQGYDPLNLVKAAIQPVILPIVPRFAVPTSNLCGMVSSTSEDHAAKYPDCARGREASTVSHLGHRMKFIIFRPIAIILRRTAFCLMLDQMVYKMRCTTVVKLPIQTFPVLIIFHAEHDLLLAFSLQLFCKRITLFDEFLVTPV